MDVGSTEKNESQRQKLLLRLFIKININATIFVLFRWLPCNRVRPCEIDEETHREGDFLIARNRKRKNGKIEYKKFPCRSRRRNWSNGTNRSPPICTAWKLTIWWKIYSQEKRLTACAIRSPRSVSNTSAPTSWISGWAILPIGLSAEFTHTFPIILWKNKWT